MRYSPDANTRRYVVNRSQSRQEAQRIRETFVDRPVEKSERVRWSWPRQMREIGQCVGVMYSSDKWQKNGEMIDYKHVSEGPQRISVVPGFLRDFENDPSGRKKLALPGYEVKVNGPMPDAFAVLAPLLGFQMRLYRKHSDGACELARGDEDLYQVDTDPQRVTLGAAKHPKTNETFLAVYDTTRLLAIITGDILDVEKDGIVG